MKRYLSDPSLLMMTVILVFNGWRAIQLRRRLRELKSREPALLGVVTPAEWHHIESYSENA